MESYIGLRADRNLSDLKDITVCLQQLSRADLRKKIKITEFKETTIIDLSTGNNHSITLIGDTSLNFIGWEGEDGETYKIVFKQGGPIGRHEIIYWGGCKFPSGKVPNLSNNVNSVDILYLHCLDNTLYGTLINDFI